eukprot:3037794-Amphidinium_carterae.1
MKLLRFSGCNDSSSGPRKLCRVARHTGTPNTCPVQQVDQALARRSGSTSTNLWARSHKLVHAMDSFIQAQAAQVHETFNGKFQNL